MCKKRWIQLWTLKLTQNIGEHSSMSQIAFFNFASALQNLDDLWAIWIHLYQFGLSKTIKGTYLDNSEHAWSIQFWFDWTIKHKLVKHNMAENWTLISKQNWKIYIQIIFSFSKWFVENDVWVTVRLQMKFFFSNRLQCFDIVV